jgi:xanthine dehydrogenase accessory factor
MKEILDIITAYDDACENGIKGALATVVHVEGSSYRKPGARMLITENGKLTGAISGGCLEGDALFKALQVMASGKTTLVTYDTNDEDDAKLGLGLGCNGIIQVLIEPLENNNVVQLLKSVVSERRTTMLVTLFSVADKKDPRAGTCFLVSETGEKSGISPVPEEILVKDAMSALRENYSVFKNYSFDGNALSAFIEYIVPQVSLVIAGGGNDVHPLADMAAILGWKTTIIHGKARGSSDFKRHDGCQVVISKPEKALENISADNQTVFVLMTHNYHYDLILLRELIKKDAVYVGVLGPAKKLSRMLNELEDEGVMLSGKQLNTIHGPVGLDIGAETPEEIALSVVAEIKAVLSGKKAGPLRDKHLVIHHQQTSY